MTQPAQLCSVKPRRAQLAFEGGGCTLAGAGGGQSTWAGQGRAWHGRAGQSRAAAIRQAAPALMVVTGGGGGGWQVAGCYLAAADRMTFPLPPPSNLAWLPRACPLTRRPISYLPVLVGVSLVVGCPAAIVSFCSRFACVHRAVCTLIDAHVRYFLHSHGHTYCTVLYVHARPRLDGFL